MALEDIGAAVQGFSTGFGLMNDWERQRLAVERERRLAERAAAEDQFRRLGLTRDIIGEYREDAPAVLQATGLPVPDAGLMGVFQRAAAKEQEAADYVMNPGRRGTQFPSLSPKHPLWPEVRAAMAEERKRAMQAQEGQAVAQAYEEGAGGIGGEQLAQPTVTSPVIRSALARARMGDRKLLDEFLQTQMYGEAQRQALQGMGPSAAGRTTTTINSKGQVTQTIRPESGGQSTSTEREARALAQLQLQQMGEEFDPTNLEHAAKLARLKSYLALRPRGAGGTLLAQQLVEEEAQGQVATPAEVAQRLSVLQRDLQAVNNFTVLREQVVAQMRQDPRLANLQEGSPRWNQMVAQRTNDAYLAQTPIVQPEGSVVTTRSRFLGRNGAVDPSVVPLPPAAGSVQSRVAAPTPPPVEPVVAEPPSDVLAKRDSLSRQVFKVPYAQLTPADKARVDKRLPVPMRAPQQAPAPRGVGAGSADVVAPGYVRRGKTPGQGEREDMASLVTTLNVTEELLNDVAQNPLAIRTFGTATQNPQGALRRFGERNLPEQYRTWTGGKLSDEELAYRAKTGMIVEQLKTELIGKQRTIPELKGLAETLPDPEQNDPRQFVVKMRELFKLLDQKLQGKGYVLSDLGFKSPAISRTPRTLPGR